MPIKEEKVVVIFEYSPLKKDELRLEQGKVISILFKNDDGWWEGIDHHGKRGLFPSNYVQELI